MFHSETFAEGFLDFHVAPRGRAAPSERDPHPNDEVPVSDLFLCKAKLAADLNDAAPGDFDQAANALGAGGGRAVELRRFGLREFASALKTWEACCAGITDRELVAWS